MGQLLLLRTAESQYKKMEVKYREYESSYLFLKKGKEEKTNEGERLRQEYENQLQRIETEHRNR